MNAGLPQNRKVKRARPRDGSSPIGERGVAALGKVRMLFQRLGHAVWPERFKHPLGRSYTEVRRELRTRGFIWIWALSIALACTAFVAHLHIRFDIIQSGYALSQAQGEQRRMRLAQRELRLEMATLKEPGRIEEQARESLGMERPEHHRIIRLSGNRGRRVASRRRR